MANIPTTQRAYTLRLRGLPGDESWRAHLWRTHEAVNRGAQVFGDWLLTLRGGIDHKLAAAKQEEERRNQRIVLALSWLSVESLAGAPAKNFQLQPTEAVKALAEILRLRGVGKAEIDSWLDDCRASLTAAIRPDAVWVNRSVMFDERVVQVGKSLTRDEVWDLFDRFFGGQEAYFEGLQTASEDDEDAGGEAEKAKDLAQKARGWLSNRFGSGTGTDFQAVADEYAGFAKWCRWFAENSKAKTADCAKQLVKLLKVETLAERLASTPGPPNRVQTTYQQVVVAIQNNSALPTADYAALADEADKQAVAKRQLIGRKEQRVWANAMQAEVTRVCRLPYRDEQAEADLINEYSVILDHAARRVCMAHSWIKRAEATRQSFSSDARKLDELRETAPEAARFLDELCEDRTKETNAAEPYRIRRGAISDWEMVVKKWSAKKCVTVEDRIQAAREAQADPENEKPGDIQLYELLAADDAKCAWLVSMKKDKQKADPELLKKYVAATDAIAKQARFKVPAYRHPDALAHPVFCDFGESRWSIDFAPHRAPSGTESAQAALERKRALLAKAQQAVEKAKDAEQRATANEKLKKATTDLAAAESELAFLQQAHAVRLRLFDGDAVATHELRWQSKRLANDLALRTSQAGNDQEPTPVARADRFGRAAAGANATTAIAIRDLFGLKEWNGRLQAPRAQLDAIAAVRDGKKLAKLSPKERAAKITKMISRLRWLVTFSAKLQPQGPWYDFIETLPPDFKYDPKKRRLYHEANRTRKGRAQITIGRIPGLRLLSVDLGHRYAAACAVWLTLSAKDFEKECEAARAKLPSTDALFHVVKRGDKRTIYRRVGPDRLLGGKGHPAPWAKLERQFLIKLPGEDRPSRKASSEEIKAVERLEMELGYQRSEPRKNSELSVDVLMAEAVRIVRLGLARHRRRAKIAFQLNTDWAPGMGQKKNKLDKAGQTELMTKALVDWHDLAATPAASVAKWSDDFAAKLWNLHIEPLLGDDEIPSRPEEETSQARKKRLTAIEIRLKPVAEKLSVTVREKLQREMTSQWDKENTRWRKRLRWLSDWLQPRGKRRGDSSIRHVGGLSVRRIATLKELYQVQKAFRTQPEPGSPIKNVPAKDDNALKDFSLRLQTTIARLRENRVKQVASRLIEAALGIGAEPNREAKHQPRRAQRMTHPQCHAIVIEKLKNYRPDETQTRRENRQLMNWAAGQVREYLDEGCQLNGLFLREVPPAYTSRQDSRTGAPGVRCNDISVEQFLKPHYVVRRAVNDLLKEDTNAPADWEPRWRLAAERLRAGKSTAINRYLVAQFEHWQSLSANNRAGRFVRVPQRGGEVFMSTNTDSPISGGLQADLNAAANIGLKALLDPDWTGTWWYVLCDGKTLVPLAESVEGGLLFAKAKPLVEPKADSKEKAEPINLWSFDLSLPFDEREWSVYGEFKAKVEYRVIQGLRQRAGLVRDRGS